MKKLFILLILFIISGCSGVKVINGTEQTFTEYVLLNKYAREGLVPETGNMTQDWRRMDSECFPGIRLGRWLETEAVVVK